MSLLEIKNLSIEYVTDGTVVKAVNNVSLSLDKKQTLGLVGETGAGKTSTALGIMRLVPNPPGKIVSGSILYDGKDLLQMSEHAIRKIRGKNISMVFQDPMTSLNPVQTVGDQIAEVIRLHERISRHEAEEKACKMLEMVGIPAERFKEYPFQFSGGMKQRVVIAIALACNPNVLIADEPTTALDVTIQAQVLAMMNELKEKLNTAMILITHDLGVVAETCEKVAIMYAGEIVESGPIDAVFNHTAHPYTKGLFQAIPSLDKDVDRLTPVPGAMPDPTDLPEGCKFHTRCPYRTEICEKVCPTDTELAPGHFVRCHRAADGGECHG